MSITHREQHTNRITANLDGGIDDTTTTVSLVDGSAFPSVGNFRVICESEIMICTARSGNDLTVVRGQDGTSAASHAGASAISMIYTAEGLSRLLQDHSGLFGYSARPPFGIWADNGLDLLDSTDFTWQNQGGATVSDRGGTMLMKCPLDSGFNLRVMEINAPATPYSYIGAFRAITKTDADAAPGFGLGFRESSSGELMVVRTLRRSFFDNGISIGVSRCTSTSAHFTSAKGPTECHCRSKHFWLKIENDGTNLKFYASPDGVEWSLVLSESKTTYFSGNPDKVCWFGLNNSNFGSGSSELHVELSHWSRGE